MPKRKVIKSSAYESEKREAKVLSHKKKSHSALDTESHNLITIPQDEQPYKLPKDWKWVRLGPLIDLHRGVSYPKAAAHNVKRKNSCLIMRGGNIEEGSINFYDNIYVDKSLVKLNQFIKKYDVIIVSSTGSTKVIGRAGISYDNYSDIAFGAFLTLARSREGVNKKFIALFFQTEMYREAIRNLAKGTNINNIRNEYIQNIPFPLPPLLEQEEIVLRIESLFKKLDRAKEIIEKVLAEFPLRKAAILHQAFTGKLTSSSPRGHSALDTESHNLITIPQDEQPYKLPKGWKWVRLGEVVQVIMGQSPKGEETTKDSCYVGLIGGAADMGEIYPIISRYTMKPTKLSKINDIIISVRATLGRPIFSDGEYCLGRGVAALRSDIIGKKFIKYFINFFEEKLITMARGSTFLQISKNDIEKLPFPLPPLLEQEEIVRRLESLFEKEERAKELCSLTEKIELMKKAILARAFRGKL